ncbi:CAP domain-containing protein [Bacteroidota bacterium]
MKRYRSLALFALLFCFICSTIQVVAQNYPASYYDEINSEAFKNDLMAEIILAELNRYRNDEGLEELEIHDVLEKAADDQAFYMATRQEVSLKNKGNKKTTAKRVILYGGTSLAEEVVMKANIKNGRAVRTYLEVAEEITKKWYTKRKTKEILEKSGYIFSGVGAHIDYDGKKVYISVVFGNHYTFNLGAKMRTSLAYPYSVKKYGLKKYDPKTCRKCSKFENIEELQKALYVRDGKIYFHYNENYKAFKRLIRNKKDGIAVDIVQRAQYGCRVDNIVDYDNRNKGVLLKPFYSKKILKRNMIPGKKVKDFMLVLGEVPNEISGPYELNLLVIQNKHVCRTITQTYIEKGDADYFNPLELVPDTVTIQTDEFYIPIPDTNELFFTIPFEKNKFEYDPEDIEEFLRALNKPDFIILELSISAYSSIEGSDEKNLMLQQKRAESIVKALEKRQQDKFISSIKTDYAWSNFIADISGTKYAFLASKNMNEAKDYIVKNNLLVQLEPILANHRYAEIKMRVTYDIKGEKEQAFVIDKFNREITKDDIPFAFSIQKYIVNKAVERIYKGNVGGALDVPESPDKAPFLINQVFLEKISLRNKYTEDYCDRIYTLHKYSPTNPYILYNKIYCDIHNSDLVNKQEIANMQNMIDALYNEKLEKELVDMLNLDFQFRVVKLNDTTPTPSQLVIKSFTKIKDIVKLDESSWTNSLELAELFIKYKDYKFALKLLEPFAEFEDLSEEFLFTYVSLCAMNPSTLMSNRFAKALAQAAEKNPRRYCDLFKGDKFSFQVFDNPFVKDYYCKNCKN